MSSGFDVLPDGIHLGLKVVAPWPSDYQHGAVNRNFGGLQQVYGFCDVPFLFKECFEARQSVSIGVIDLTFTAAAHEADCPSGVFKRTNKRAGNFFFVDALGVFLLVADLKRSKGSWSAVSGGP